MKGIAATAVLSGMLSACSNLGRPLQEMQRPSVSIETADVDRFFVIYDAAGGSPDAKSLQSYINDGSPGLRVLAERRRVTGQRMAAAIATRPDLYTRARACAAILPAVRPRLDAAMTRLIKLYPKARTPAVTIAVGRGQPVGIGYPDTGVQIGLEALCAAEFLNANVEDRFVFVIAHEYVHVQQSPELSARVDSNMATVLDVALAEGIAEFVGELISGQVAYGSLRAATEGREAEIERAFLADKDKTDLSAWVYNSSPERPGDLGYWVGYRIAKFHYNNAADKRQALAAMLEMTDANAFLAMSGWQPGAAVE